MYVQQAKFAKFGGRSSFNLAFFEVDCWMHTKCRISGFWKYFVRRGAYARMYYNSDPGVYRNGPKFGPNSDPMSTETGQNFEQVRSCLRTEWPSRYRTPIQSIRVEIFSVLAPRAQPLRSSTPYSLPGCSPDRTNSWSSEVVMCWLWLGLKAMALAWLWVALASRNPKPGQDCWLGLGLAWLWPEPWLLAVGTHFA